MGNNNHSVCHRTCGAPDQKKDFALRRTGAGKGNYEYYPTTDRGGGVGGWKFRGSANAPATARRKKRTGKTITKTATSGGYSNFCFCSGISDFFSVFFPAAIALHKQQGCLPSKVLPTAAATESVVRLPTSMPVHATVCNMTKGPAVATNIATIRSNLPSHWNTFRLSPPLPLPVKRLLGQKPRIF